MWTDRREEGNNRFAQFCEQASKLYKLMDKHICRVQQLHFKEQALRGESRKVKT
jgi:hypothetical protein